MASTYELIIKAVDQTSGPLNRIEKQLKDIERQTKRINLGNTIGTKQAAGAGALAGAISKIPGPLVAIGAAAATAGAGMAAIINATKDFQRVENGLRLISDGSADLANKMGLLRNISQETRTDFNATADLFTKLTISTEQMGVSSETVATATANLSKALQLAGADGNTASSVIRQFGQAMASGEVRGDEFRSIVEGLGPALSIMARETGISVGELRKMSQSGQLTAKVMLDMLVNSKALGEEFGKMVPTLDSLETALGNAFDRALVNIGKASGITQAYEGILKGLTKTFNDLSRAIEADDSSLASVTERLKAQHTELKRLESMTEKQIGKEVALTRGTYNHDRAVRNLKDEIARLTEIQSKLTAVEAAAKAEKDKLNASDRVRNKILTDQQLALAGIQPYLALIEAQKGKDSAYELADAVGKATMELQALQQAARSFDADFKTAFPDKSSLEKMKLRQGLTEALIIADANLAKAERDAAKAIAEKTKADAEAAEALKRQNDPLYDLTKNYEELFARYKKVTDAQYELTAQIGRGNKATDEQRTIMKSLGDEASELAKQLGFATTNFGTLTATDAITALNELDTKLKQAKESLTDYAQLAASGTSSLSNEQLTASTVALKEQIKQLTDERNKLLGVSAKEKTVQEKLVEDYKEQNKQLKQIEDALNNVNVISKETGVGVDIITQNLYAQRDALDVYKKKILDLGEVIEATFKEASKTMVSELSRGIVQGKGLLDSFKNAFDNLLDTILQKIIESQINNALFNLTGGFLGSQTSMNPAGLFGGKIIPGFLANGGPAQANKPYIVGERGPELFMPNSGGTVVPNEQLNMGSGETTNITFQINSIDTQTGTQFLLDNKNKIIGMITQAQNQRGRQGILT